MATISLNNEQLRLIQTALDFYSRMGILQFERLLDHPTIDNNITDRCTIKKTLEVGDMTVRGEIVKITKKYIDTKGSWGKGEEIKRWTDIDKIKITPDWGKIQDIKYQIEYHLNQVKCLIAGNTYSTGASYGIHSPNVDESCREAFDIIQVIRHEFWKENPNRSYMTVDSSISMTTNKDMVKVQLDTAQEVRKRKIKKLKV